MRGGRQCSPSDRAIPAEPRAARLWDRTPSTAGFLPAAARTARKGSRAGYGHRGWNPEQAAPSDRSTGRCHPNIGIRRRRSAYGTQRRGIEQLQSTDRICAPVFGREFARKWGVRCDRESSCDYRWDGIGIAAGRVPVCSEISFAPRSESQPCPARNRLPGQYRLSRAARSIPGVRY